MSEKLNESPTFDATDDAANEIAEINLDFGDFVAGEQPKLNEDEVVIDLSDDGDGENNDDEVPLAAASGDDEEDPEIAAALLLLHDTLSWKPGDWYVVHTYSGMENRVKQNIDFRVNTMNMEEFIFEAVVPTEDAVEIRSGARRTVSRTVLPGYVLVRMELTDDSWSAVRHTPNVTGFVGQGNKPVALRLEEVERMLTPGVIAKVNANRGGAPKRGRKKVEVLDYALGDSVMVVDGPFSGVHATITEINANSQRVKANVEILGRETPVDLDFTQIQKND
ncbi:MAG: transcription termination/antitermination protein NusG [Propionibacteriaceae bacterium]|jgi:transcriptional antiterminator NusG|nr:transcription termination/antitermination protein NusG [Propionibacteriaceae bacterium]